MYERGIMILESTGVREQIIKNQIFMYYYLLFQNKKGNENEISNTIKKIRSNIFYYDDKEV